MMYLIFSGSKASFNPPRPVVPPRPVKTQQMVYAPLRNEVRGRKGGCPGLICFNLACFRIRVVAAFDIFSLSLKCAFPFFPQHLQGPVELRDGLALKCSSTPIPSETGVRSLLEFVHFS